MITVRVIGSPNVLNVLDEVAEYWGLVDGQAVDAEDALYILFDNGRVNEIEMFLHKQLGLRCRDKDTQS